MKQKFFKVMAVAGAIALTTGVTAQNWVKTSAPDTINYQGIRTFGNDTIYAWGITGTSYKPNKLISSFDGGQTWSVHNMSTNYSGFVASPAGLHVNWQYSVNMKVEYTTDGGATWQLMQGSEGYKLQGQTLLPNGKLLLGENAGGYLNVSPDYISMGTNYGSIYQYKTDYWTSDINPSSGRIILGRSNGETHLGISDDNCQTITDVSLANLIGNIHSPLVSYSKNNTWFNARLYGMLVSTDDGNTWASCNTNAFTGGLKDMTATPNRVVAGLNDGHVFSSTDNGQSWSLFMNGLPDTLGISGLGKTNNGRIWLTEGTSTWTESTNVWNHNGGIWYTDDASTTTGVTEAEQQTILNIYPNPAKTVLNIETREPATVKIHNVLGVMVATHKLNAGNNSIDVSGLTNGVYLISNEKGNILKFIRE